MTIQHQSISDPYLHEPKGVASAPAGTAYLATGLGSGSWEPIAKADKTDFSEAALVVSNGATTTAVVAIIDKNLVTGTFTPLNGPYMLAYNTGLDFSNPSSGVIRIINPGLYVVTVSADLTAPSEDAASIGLSVDQIPGSLHRQIVTPTSLQAGVSKHNFSFQICRNISSQTDIRILIGATSSIPVVARNINFSVRKVIA